MNTKTLRNQLKMSKFIPMSESKLQQRCVTWFRYAYPKASRFLIAVPNGGRRDAKTGAQMKKEGAIAGVSDLILFDPIANAMPMFIEMKLPKGRQSETQMLFQNEYEAAGYRYEIVRTLDEFIEVVMQYMGKYDLPTPF